MPKKHFIKPEHYEDIEKNTLQGPNGWLLFAACNEGIELAERVKEEYELLLKDNKSSLTKVEFLNDSAPDAPEDKRIIRRFEDTETAPRLPKHVAGSNVFVFQNVHELISGNTANDNYYQLLEMIRTLKVHGARTVTAVTPYSKSARQEQPSFLKRESSLAEFAADLMKTAGADGIIIYHPHSESIRGYYEDGMRFTSLNGLDLFISIAKESKFNGMKNVVCVSTDAGGAKLTIHYAKALNVDYAISNKYRPKQEEAEIIGIIGNLEGKTVALLADDESVTFTSLLNAAKQLYKKCEIPEIYMCISHNKIRHKHIHKLKEAYENYGLKELHVTDSIPGQIELPFIEVHSLARRFAVTINRLHYNLSVSEMFYK